MNKSSIFLLFFFLLYFCHKTAHAQFEFVETPTSKNILDIHCFNEFCVISDNSSLIFKTYDLGNSFIMLNSPAQSGKYDLVCIDTNLFFIAASSAPISPVANIFKTTNGGYNWITMLDTIAVYWAFDMLNEQKGIIAGGVEGKILQTNNGWETSFLQSTGFNLYLDVRIVDTNNIFLADFGSIIKSNDGGFSWSVVTTFGFLQPSKIYNLSKNVLFFTANNNTGQKILKRSTDGGTTWSTLISGGNSYLYGIEFINENEGYITGYNYIEKQGALLYTYDGGETWNELLCGYDKKLYEIEQANDSILLIGGEDGLLLRFNRNQVTTGSREVSRKNSRLEVFPNPTSGEATFHIELSDMAELEVALYSCNGLKVLSVFRGKAGPGTLTQTLDLSGLPSGYYLMKAISRDGLSIRPIVKF